MRLPILFSCVVLAGTLGSCTPAPMLSSPWYPTDTLPIAFGHNAILKDLNGNILAVGERDIRTFLRQRNLGPAEVVPVGTTANPGNPQPIFVVRLPNDQPLVWLYQR